MNNEKAAEIIAAEIACTKCMKDWYAEPNCKDCPHDFHTSTADYVAALALAVENLRK